MKSNEFGIVCQRSRQYFYLLRLIAASAVLYSHCFSLLSGDPSHEPLVKWLGVTPGSIAVDIFFVTSGFLVTASLLASGNALDFLLARAVRIYPGLWVMTLLSVFVLGLGFTTLTTEEFLAHPQTWRFLQKDLTLFGGITVYLPGVFTNVPMPVGVNGSLWTLPYEVRIYCALLALWLVVVSFEKLAKRRVPCLLLLVCCGVLLASGYKHFSIALVEHDVDQRYRLAFMFFSGSVYWLLRERICMTYTGMALAGIAIAISTIDRTLFFCVYHFLIAYLVLCLAYLPSGSIRKFNGLGDYSYGIYIYAFPVQQSIVAIAPEISLATYIAASLICTMTLAAMSWHWIERPAMRLGATWRGHLKSRQLGSRAVL